jgi:hypothetical protein
MRQEGKKIYMATIYAYVCVYACSALSVYVFVLALSYKTLHSRRRHIYNVKSKRKEKADTHSLLLALSHRLFSLPSYSPSPTLYAHIHSDYCLTRTHCVKDKQASKQGKAKQSSIYIYTHTQILYPINTTSTF